jgi:hypothetical protein
MYELLWEFVEEMLDEGSPRQIISNMKRAIKQLEEDAEYYE